MLETVNQFNSRRSHQQTKWNIILEKISVEWIKELWVKKVFNFVYGTEHLSIGEGLKQIRGEVIIFGLIQKKAPSSLLRKCLVFSFGTKKFKFKIFSW